MASEEVRLGRRLDLQGGDILQLSKDPEAEVDRVTQVVRACMENPHELEVPLRTEQINPLLDRLHDLKNEIFFKSVTDEALDLYAQP